VAAHAATTTDAIDYLRDGPASPGISAMRAALVDFLGKELGTDSLDRAKTYMEDALRMTVHLVMSTAEYQLV
jgi:hypothetical protein